jgi:hypothetical protein
MNVQNYGELRGDGSTWNRPERHDPAAPRSSSQQVHVEIDELVLTGFTQSQCQEIADSLKETLTHLVADDMARWNGSESMNVETLDAGKVQMYRSGRAQFTGERVARAIYESLPT